jgi:hypothetical protein
MSYTLFKHRSLYNIVVHKVLDNGISFCHCRSLMSRHCAKYQQHKHDNVCTPKFQSCSEIWYSTKTQRIERYKIPEERKFKETNVEINEKISSSSDQLKSEESKTQVLQQLNVDSKENFNQGSIKEESLQTDTTATLDEELKKPGIFKRFHQTYKKYGKVLVGVHIFTSTIWTGLFYSAAVSGVNIEPFLQFIGASEKIIHIYTMPGVGNAAVAYLFYKIATPARYTVTIGGTHLAVKYLRRWGYMDPVPESDSLRSLVKDGKIQVKAKYDKYHDKMENIKDEQKEMRSKDAKK